MDKIMDCPHCEEEITLDDLARVLRARLSAVSSRSPEQLEKIFCSMYTLCKERLGFTDEEAMLTAQNAVDSVSGK